ncbi:SapB/AmfS family lanthipeptide [Streptomyces sp. MST-110588]|nr:SapB/AmfS family lanthipeptide [Streptomyces sp. MST-110588]
MALLDLQTLPVPGRADEGVGPEASQYSIRYCSCLSVLACS